MTMEMLLNVIGEIAIIVIGVLVALAADQWRKKREEIKREQELLSGLSEDLKSDVDGLEAFIEQVKAAKDATISTLRMIRSQEEPVNTRLARQLILVALGYEPVHSMATYTELSGGNFYLLRSNELRRQVINYYAQLTLGQRANAATTPQAWYDSGIEPYLKLIFEALPPGDWFAWIRGEAVDLDSEEIMEKVRTYPNIERYLESALRVRVLQIAKYEAQVNAALELRQVVLKEMKK